MKMFFTLALVLALALSLVGCLGNAPSPVSQSQQFVDQQATVEETLAETEAETEAVTESKANVEDEKIGEEKAKKIALDHAGLKEADVKHLFVELDYDDGILRYEVDFRQGKYEYDYNIDAKTGKILSYDKDIDD